MKRLFSSLALVAVVAIAGGLACSDDSSRPPGPGSVAGRVTFIGTWPATGDVQVSVYSSLKAPAYRPTGAPDAFTNPILSGTMEFDYELPGLDIGTYTGVLVSWRVPSNPSGAKIIGAYWFDPDSVAANATGDTIRTPGPTAIRITTSDPKHTGLDIKADLDIAP